MRVFIFFLLFLVSVFGRAQSDYPNLFEQNLNYEALIPYGWTPVAKVEGDLNKDKRDDVAFVIEKNIEFFDNTDSIVKPKTLRILGVYTKQKNGLFVKHTQSNSFIISKENDGMYEPFQGIFINDGFLEINFQIWKSENKMFISTHSYRFKMDDNNLYLITYNAIETNRETGDSNEFTVDFDGKRLTSIYNNYLKNSTSRTDIQKINVDFLQKLTDLKEPLKWAFNGIKI